MRRETLQESREQLLELSESQVVALRAAGRKLASSKPWWGQSEPDESRSKISCEPAGSGLWRVTILNAVGLVSIGDLQIAVQPKIPQSHLLYLFARSTEFPVPGDDRAYGEIAADLWQLVALWFVAATERLLRSELIRDYELTAEELPVLRGSFDLLSATVAVHRGRLQFECEFDEFSADTALNRVLKAASRSIAASTLLQGELRKRAMRLQSGMEDVGELRSGDLGATLDRRTHGYEAPFTLAKHVLYGQGRLMQHGAGVAWTFLIPTPALVEQGLRAVLTEGLKQQWSVQKKGLTLDGSALRFNPDLIFGNRLAVGDVKYKLLGRDWNRPDLNQVLAFAVAYRSKHCAVVGFRTTATKPLVAENVGDIRVQELCWLVDASISGSTAAQALIRACLEWLRGISTKTNEAATVP